MATHIVNFPDAHVQSTKITATASVGIGTSGVDAYPLTIFKETEPEIRIHEGATSSSAARLYSNNSNLYIQTGTNFTTGSSGDIAFQTMGGQATHMIVKSDGKVGVGTTDPQYRLDVGYGGGDVMLRVMNTHSSTGKLIFGRSGNTDIRSHAIECTNSGGAENNVMKFLVHDGSAVVPHETRTEVMTLLGNGNVGIGTDSPECLLHLSSDTGSASIVPTKLKIHTTTQASDWDNTHPWGLIEFDTDDTSFAGSGPIAGIGVRSGDTTGGYPQLCFYTDNAQTYDTTLGSANERMVIDHNGKVGIGTNDPQGKLHIYQSGASSTNLVDKHTSRTTGDYNQSVNYTHYASIAEGVNRDPDNSRGLWIGNMVDENDLSPSGANFMAFTNNFTFYGVDDNTKWDSGLNFTSNTDDLLYSGGTFNKCVRINADGNVGIGITNPGAKLHVNGYILQKAFTFMVYGSGGSLSSNKSILYSTTNTVAFDKYPTISSSYTQGFVNSGINKGMYFAPISGYYYFVAKIRINDNITSDSVEIEWYKKNTSGAESDVTSFEMWMPSGDPGGRRNTMSSIHVYLSQGEAIIPRNDGNTSGVSSATFSGHYIGY